MQPYTVIFITTHEAIRLKLDSGNEFKVNGQCHKHYLKGEITTSETI